MEHKQAKEEVKQTAQLILEMALAIRQYTLEEVGPAFQNCAIKKSQPQAIPSYAAIYTFERLRKNLPNYIYKESVLNPKNPVHRASEWEVELINAFRSQKDLKVLTGNRQTRSSHFMFLAMPFVLHDKACLKCHSTSSQAPPDIVEQYGENGFGWKLDEVLGARIIMVPSAIAHEKAKNSILTLLISISCVFALIIITINLILQKSVVQPMEKLSGIAEQISFGNKFIDTFPLLKIVEFKQLMSSIQRLRISRDHTLNVLDKFEKQNSLIHLKMEDILSEPE